jgi:hypothetical protein
LPFFNKEFRILFGKKTFLSVDSTNFAKFLLNFSKISLSKIWKKKKQKKALICMEELVSLIREIGEWCDESWQG